MPDELEARIRKVEDFQEITNLQARYSYLIDDLQFVYEALHPREQEVANGVIGKLREKRRGA